MSRSPHVSHRPAIGDTAAPTTEPTGTPRSEPDVIRRERAALREVLRLVRERAASEARIAKERRDSDTTADAEYQKARQAMITRFSTQDANERAADQARRRGIVDAAIFGETQAKTEFASASRKIASEFDASRENTKVEFNRDKLSASANFESAKKKAQKEHAEARKPIDDMVRIANGHRKRLERLAIEYRKFKLNPEPPAPSRETYSKFTDIPEELFGRLSRMEAPLKLLEGLIIPKSMKGSNEIWVFVVVTLSLIGLAVYAGASSEMLGAATGVGLALSLAVRFWLVQLSSQQLARLYVPLRQSLADADGLATHGLTEIDKRRDQAIQHATERRATDLKKAQEDYSAGIARAESLRDDRLRKINEIYASRMVDVQTTQQRDLRDAIDLFDRRILDLTTQSEASLRKLDENYRNLKAQIAQRHDTAYRVMADLWRQGIMRASSDIDQVNREVDEYGPTWNDPRWNDRALPRLVPPVLRFGDAALDLAALPDGLPTDTRLMQELPSRFNFPALRAFPGGANLLIESSAEGRNAALGVLRASMFRLLTSLPPGQVRFTIVDPVGIGRGFGAFMHLADFDEALVNGQVWTEARLIEERLDELANHMERVTQKYLRDEYASIEEYNAVADEVAEAYRVLVVADFPTQFTEKAAARLAAIAAGGVPCGVITIVAVDPAKPMPTGFHLDDLRPACAQLQWNGTELAWDDPDLSQLPVVIDSPPPGELAARQIQIVGAAARDAKRVEVPFEFIAPAPETWWTGDTRNGIDVALGKAGATKRQNLTLGQGTSQHVLIAGRTGSGKSTLLHALITNLALHYSPDEVDLYLIDFKKGVEFKVYATHELPHASVVAIESEREFGLSVLQRLDVELRVRAEKFREVGVQDLNGYRNAPGTPPMPRVLLIVDEFQEFFVEEDKLAQEAALLLDRLVRQGRAFGVHVHLGSQSLGGAFTLARSTLGQMAVRIALQCSEVDSHLILSEQNPAARMLSRPGEAIYNDANGAPEGNHFFQVVWLSDARREDYLEKLHDLARQHPPRLARKPIVFEGDAPADPARNPLLQRQLEGDTWPASPRAAQAWLGDPVAIKEPTAALFRRQGGNHLLIVGQNEEAALGVMIAALVSLVAQFPPAPSMSARDGARFLVLDGTPEDHPHFGLLERTAAHLPHGVTVGNWRQVDRTLAAAAAELHRRQQEEGSDGPEVFLIIHDLPRFRSLRRREDDFSFSRRDDDAGPPDHLESLLREGPPLGLHVIAWCDTASNLNRHFTHQLLREFEMRVLFQMSPNDSGQLLDSPHASKLGPHRALFSSEEQNRLEKFRPYGLPTDDWLKNLAESFARRPAVSLEPFPAPSTDPA